MNPLLAIAASILPDLIKLVAGDKGGQLADKVVKTVSDTVGTSDATEAKARLKADLATEAALHEKLAELALDAAKAQNLEAEQKRQDEAAESDKKRQAELDQLKGELQSTQAARVALKDLATTDPTIA